MYVESEPDVTKVTYLLLDNNRVADVRVKYIPPGSEISINGKTLALSDCL
ncbi:MAG: hypothetical protein AAF191_13460 [Verrucomicrobiota bacterium]